MGTDEHYAVSDAEMLAEQILDILRGAHRRAGALVSALDFRALALHRLAMRQTAWMDHLTDPMIEAIVQGDVDVGELIRALDEEE